MGRSQSASPEVKGSDGDALGGTELRGAQSSSGKTVETLDPGLAGGVPGATDAESFGGSSNKLGHRKTSRGWGDLWRIIDRSRT
jgi:hypothetical protein